MKPLLPLSYLLGILCTTAWSQPGALDPSFGNQGLARFNLAQSADFLRDIALLPDGGILALGEMDQGFFTGTVQCLVRYDAGGMPDAGFGEGGMVKLHSFGLASALRVQPDGKILIAGGWGPPSIRRFQLMRLLPDGTPDPDFGAGGIAVGPSVDRSGALGLTLLPDGRIAIAGYAENSGAVEFLVVRFLPDGTADTTFGDNGLAFSNFDDFVAEAYALAVQPDGKLVAAGRSYASIATARFHVDGSLDDTFGDGGMATGDFGYGQSVALQPDGKILVGGYLRRIDTTETRLVRFLPDGTTDVDFNPPPLVTGVENWLGEGIFKNDMLLQPNGKILLSAFGEFNGPSDLILMRYNADGSRDGSFGIAGFAVSDFSPVYERGTALALRPDGGIVLGGISNYDFALQSLDTNGNSDPDFNNGRFNLGRADDLASQIAVQDDGKILTGGVNTALTGNSRTFLLARLLPDGSIDGSFANQGLITAGEGTALRELRGMLLQPDGKILAAGNGLFGTMAATRFLADGTVDTSFGENGLSTLAYGEEPSYCQAIALQEDGKMLVAGRYTESFDDRFAILRLNPDGSLDPSFGTDGIVITAFPDDEARITALAIQPDGKIVAGGYEELPGTNEQFALARYLPDGALDATFGTGGITTILNGNSCEIRSLALQPNGKILALGDVVSLGKSYLSLLRLLPDGTPDPSFGQEGWVTSTFGLEQGRGYGLAYLPDGTIVACGIAGTLIYERFALAHFLSDGSPDTGFGSQGYVLTDFGGEANEASALALQPDGKVVVAGVANIPGEDLDFALARYLLDLNVGLLDFSSTPATAFIYPNPVGGEATLQFTLPKPALLTIDLLDLQGRQVAVFAKNEPWPAGEHIQPLAFGLGLAAGSYYLRITDGSKQVVVKMIKR